MTTFNWLGGSMSDSSSWGPQPDEENPVVPGAGDIVNISLDGTLSGSISVLQANLSATLELDGTIETSGGTILDGADLTVNGGENDAQVLLIDDGSYELDTGDVDISTNEFVSEIAGETATFVQKGGTHTVGGALEVAYGGGTGSFTLSGGNLTSNQVFVGQNGTGTFTQTGGKHTVADRIVLGVNVTSGALGTGTYTLGGTGKLSMKEIFIGSDPSCHGTFNFNAAAGDAATLTVSATGGFPGLIVGGQGIGTMTQGSGAVSTTLSVGFRTGGQGTYNFNGGTITSTNEKIGDSGTGTFIQMGGTNKDSTSDVIVGNASGAVGTYQLHAGSLSLTGAGITVGAQANSTGDFQFNTGAGDSGAIESKSLTVTVGDGGSGSFEMGAGTLNANLELAAQVGSEGAFKLDGGTISAPDSETIGDAGTGTFTQTAGANTVDSGNLFVGNDGDGTYTLGGTGALTVNGGDFDLAEGGGSSGKFDFNTAANDDATIGVESKLITVGVHGDASFTMGGGTLDAKLVVGGQVGAHGAVSLTGGTIMANGQVVGNNGGGKFTMKGGEDKITSGGDLILGAFAAGGGTFTLSNGALSDGGELVGYAGAGHVNQSGGTNKIAGTGSLLDLGTQTAAVGTYVLSGGQLKAIEELIGDSGTGTFTQKGGTNAIAGSGEKLELGAQSGGVGSYVLSGGNLTSALEIVGEVGTGKFTQSGGKNAISGSGAELDIAAKAADTGSYSLSKGDLIAASELIGDFGKGSLKQTGGVNELSGTLYVGMQSGAKGTYTLTGGKLTAASEVVGSAGSGTFSQSGGSNAITGNLTIGKTGSGAYKLTGGTMSLTGTTSEIVLGAATNASGSLSVEKGTVKTPELVFGPAGTGHVTTETGGVIAVSHEIVIATGSVLTSKLGAVVIGSSKATAGSIVIAKGGLLIGAGTATAAIHETSAGSVEAHGGILSLIGDVGGGGKLLIDNGAELALGAGDTNTIVFEGAAGTLKLDQPSSVTGQITGLQAGNIIDLAGIHAKSAVISHSTLTVTETDSSTLTFTVKGALSGTAFSIKSDGHGGSDLVLKSTAPGEAPAAGHAAFEAVAPSTGQPFSTIDDFDARNDVFNLPVAVNGIDAAVSGGVLSRDGFGADLATAIDASRLGAHEAVIYRPTSGDFAGHTFLIVDANGKAGYQAGHDFVFELAHPAHLGALGMADFA